MKEMMGIFIDAFHWEDLIYYIWTELESVVLRFY